ncbi:helix-hairpin-helix domain-containing protein [Nocardia sp. 2]|uniref:Helix-hairpin-helix domain-containing protein n=1 Tax=Nocardia acididurans TaxID=2802282 RepID=A0ABS1MDT2_9NOCA|nr:helix-hairpin-helix domain-containing protein [Nocardia acididurans]MBL1078424.1 helix-hairpin-helix domain-containing protein [Nocardia acididurans]
MPRTDFTPTRAHSARWHEESVDDEPDARSHRDCHADDWTDSPGRPRRAESPSPTWQSDPPDFTERWHERLVPARFHGTRWDPGPRGVLILAALGVIAVLLAATASFQQKPVTRPVPPITPAAATDTNREHRLPPDGPTPPSTTTSGKPSPAAEVVVSVVGLVEHGGLRRFPPGARIADAVKAASPHPEADLSGLNLAQPLRDGDQIVIGRTDPTPGTPQLGSTLTNAAQATGIAATGESPRPTGTPAKVDLNTATEAELDALPGVGPVTARAILAWRTQHGRFTSVDQLAEVDGIGPSRLARLRNAVTV